MDSHGVPLVLNALNPISLRVLRKGFVEAGQDWMWVNWGERWPIRRVTFRLRQGFGGRVAIERRDTSGGKPVEVFCFLSKDWSPWIALVRMRERWRSCGSR